MGDDRITSQAVSEDTGGAYAFWIDEPPAGVGPPRHVHSREEEGFYVVPGEADFRAGHIDARVGKDTFIALPKGIPHGWKNVSETGAKLTTFTAAGGNEGFFLKLGAPGDGPPDPRATMPLDEINRRTEQYGVTYMGETPNPMQGALTGLPASIGVGKGTCLLQDLDLADAIFVWGQNPGTNSPRMMTSLRDASRRGARVVSFNPFRERALLAFAAPEDAIEVATGRGTRISAPLLQVRVGGDAAALKGIMKTLLEADDAAAGGLGARVLDWPFIEAHTAGFEPFAADLRATPWDAIVRQSGLSKAQVEEVARIYAEADAVVLVYGMGITQHRRGTDNVQHLVNLALMHGNIGHAGADICPVRGHSNVQGDRSVGITELPTPDMLDRIRDVFGFEPPRKPGRATMAALEAMGRGESRAFMGLGGNFAGAVPDALVSQAAMSGLDLTVQVSTKLSGRRISLPVPDANNSGSAPRMAHIVVIRIGRKRIRQAWRMLSSGARPPRSASMAKSTSMMPFFFTMPISSTRPIRPITSSDSPAARSASSAPTPADGSVDRIVSGCTTLSYSTPRMMYTTTSAARISGGSLDSEDWNACALPWKLPARVSGTPNSFCAWPTAATASPSAPPGGRLKDRVTAANWFWWLTCNGLVRPVSSRTKVDSGTWPPVTGEGKQSLLNSAGSSWD